MLGLFAASPALAQPESDRTRGGYIDSAIITNQVRFRFDAGYDLFPPDRAEFFYAKCGCFGTPDARGPALPETDVDYQEFRGYFEYAANDWFSGFVEIPMRLINPEVNPNTGGLSDIQAGCKVGLWGDDDQYLTFQLRVYAPTGDPDRGLGTAHTSIEPGILFFKQLDERWTLEAELRDWIPVGGSDFAGNVLRYGVGVSCNMLAASGWCCGDDCCCDEGCCDADCCTGGACSEEACCSSCDAAEGFLGMTMLGPVVELVGWTVLDGMKFDGIAPLDASGDTIINIKAGVRAIFNQRTQLYVGYGSAITDDHWYQDIVRVEVRRPF